MSQYYDIKSIILPHNDDELHIMCGHGEIEDGAVTPVKTSFFVRTENMFDKDAASPGWYVVYTDGHLRANESYWATDYMPVTAGSNYTMNVSNQMAFYDSSKAFVSGLGGTQSPRTVTAPESAAYLRVTVAASNVSSFMIVEGSEVPKYEPYYIMPAENVGVIVTRSAREIFAARVVRGTSPKIVLIGDSITAGVGGTGYSATGEEIITIAGTTYYRNEVGYCWANVLKKYIEAKISGATVINNGISGMTTTLISTETRLNSLIPSDTDLVICALGTNSRDLDPANIANHYQTLINHCDRLGIGCVLVANIPAGVSNETSHTLHMEDIARLVEAASTGNDRGFVDLFGEFKRYLLYTGAQFSSLMSDALHPNDTGYLEIFYMMCDLLGMPAPVRDATWFDPTSI